MTPDTAQLTLPINGKAPRQRHASASGARYAAIDRPSLALAYLELLRRVGPLSDHAAAKALGRPLSSMCSTRNGLGCCVMDSGSYELSEWGTKRTQWALAPREPQS